jgi:hypothetical protein
MGERGKAYYETRSWRTRGFHHMSAMSGPAPALPAIEVCQGRQRQERAMAEKGECSFRTASIDAGEMTLWVKSRHQCMSA